MCATQSVQAEWHRVTACRDGARVTNYGRFLSFPRVAGDRTCLPATPSRGTRVARAGDLGHRGGLRLSGTAVSTAHGTGSRRKARPMGVVAAGGRPTLHATCLSLARAVSGQPLAESLVDNWLGRSTEPSRHRNTGGIRRASFRRIDPAALSPAGPWHSGGQPHCLRRSKLSRPYRRRRGSGRRPPRRAASFHGGHWLATSLLLSAVWRLPFNRLRSLLEALR
jgi:hypothetical protein